MLEQDKGLKGILISVLGTDYTLRCVDSKDMPSWFFENCKGNCDHTVKVITVEDLVKRKEDYKDTLGDLETVTNQAVRHELIHAFMRESGLGDESDIDEVMIDWFALQAPKLFEAFCQAKAFLPEEIRRCSEAFQKDNEKEIKSNVVKGFTNGH